MNSGLRAAFLLTRNCDLRVSLVKLGLYVSVTYLHWIIVAPRTCLSQKRHTLTHTNTEYQVPFTRTCWQSLKSFIRQEKSALYSKYQIFFPVCFRCRHCCCCRCTCCCCIDALSQWSLTWKQWYLNKIKFICSKHGSFYWRKWEWSKQWEQSGTVQGTWETAA